MAETKETPHTIENTQAVASLEAANSVTRESYDRLKAEMNRMQDEVSKYKAREQIEAQHKQEKLGQLASQTKEFFETLKADNAGTPQLAHIESCAGWHDTWAGDNVSKLPLSDIDRHTDLAVVMCAASAKMKRTRDNDDVLKEKTEELQKAFQEKDHWKGEFDKMSRRMTEAEELARERQEQNEQLSVELERAIHKTRLNNFANPAMREMRRETVQASASKVSSTAPVAARGASEEVAKEKQENTPIETTSAAASKESVVEKTYASASKRHDPNGSLSLAEWCASVGKGSLLVERNPHSNHKLWGGMDDGPSSSNAAGSNMMDIAAAIRSRP